MESVQDERVSFIRYHPGKDRFIFNTNTPSDLHKVHSAAAEWPNTTFNRKFSFIEVAASPSISVELRRLVELLNISIGKAEDDKLSTLEATAHLNYTLTGATEGVSESFDVKGTPHPFQIVGAHIGLQNQKVLIGDEPGLGKTIEGILILSKLSSPAVIVCPKRAIHVWKRELLNWIPGITVDDILILRGSKAKKIPDKRFVIVNYEILTWWAFFIDALGRDVFIVDEIHKLGNPASKRSRTAYFLLRNASHRIGTTGTAARNRPRHIIHVLDVLGIADTVGGPEFLMRRFGQEPKTDDVGERKAYAQELDRLNTWLRQEGVYVRRTKESVRLQLPLKQREVIPIELANRAEYERAANEFASWAAQINAIKTGGLAEWANLVIQQKLLDLGTDVAPKITNYKTAPVSLQGMARINSLKQLAFLGKLPGIKEWVDDLLETGEKLVLFAWFKESQKILRSMWPSHSTATILGTDDDRHKEHSIWRFQNDPNTRLIICSIKAASEAITLTAASHVAHVEFPWEPVDMAQAEDRVHRIGQTRPVTCSNLVGLDTIEEDILNLLSDRLSLLSHVHDGKAIEEMAVINPLLSTLIERARYQRKPLTMYPEYSGNYSTRRNAKTPYISV